LVTQTRFHPFTVGNDGGSKSSQVGIRLDRERPGQFLREFKGLDGAGVSLVAASIRLFRLLHMGEILAEGKGNGLPLSGLKLLPDLWISQLEPWHTRHKDVAPPKDVGGGIDEIGPGSRSLRTLMQEARVELFGRELPPEERFTSQHGVASVLLIKRFCPKVPKGMGSTRRKRPRWNRSRAACNCASEGKPRC